MSDEILLTIDGEVESRRQLTFADLAAVDKQYQIDDVSQLVPSRKGGAITLEGLLELARPTPSATHLTLHASADDFHASVPLSAVAGRGFFIYQRDGRPLDLAAGGPLRFYIPDHAACHSSEVDECANVKFVDRVELTAGKGFDNRPQDDAEHAALHESE